MNKAIMVAAGVLWLASIAVTGGVTWHVAASRQAAADAREEEAKPIRAAGGETELAKLKQENAELRARAGELLEERNDARNENLRLALGQALQEIAQSAPVSDEVGERWRKAFRTREERKKQSSFGGLDEDMALISEMARLGREGVDFLSSAVSNHGLDMREREAALLALSHIRDKAALAAILKLREPDLTELDYPYDLILLQMCALSTPEIREFIPEINAQIDRDLAMDDISPERTEVLAVLAFVHGDSRSWELLHDERALQENLTAAARMAAEIHSPEARQFVEWTAANHPRPNVRQEAEVLLGEW